MTILERPRVFAYSQSGEKKRERFRIPGSIFHLRELSIDALFVVAEPQTLARPQ